MSDVNNIQGGQAPDNASERLDNATAARLARLGSMSVDTSDLRRALALQLPPPPAQRPAIRRLTFWGGHIRPLAVAASILFAALALGWVLLRSAAPAMAAPADLAQIHSHMLSAGSQATPVASISEAATVLEAALGKHPKLPNIKAPARCCCVHSISGKKAACVCFESDAGPVTLIVADPAHLRSQPGPTITRAGKTYTTHAQGATNLVTAQRDGLWFCLMGEQPADQLIALASSMGL